jgi:hypothetical protein
MGPEYMLLGDTPREADVENVSNTGLEIWNCIFKDKSWLELALTFDGCSPVLLGYHLNRFGPTRKPTKLYVALLARDYSGDLRWMRDEFFASLQDGWEYDEPNYEVLFPTGLTVNVYEVLTGCDEARLPLPKIFINRKNGVHSEYCIYTDMGIRGLGPSQILGYGTGSAHRGRALKKGAKLLLFDGKGQREYFIAPWSGKQRKIWI